MGKADVRDRDEPEGRKFRNIDEFRHAIERIPAPVYLDSSYYERWLNAMMTLLVEKKKVTREELIACGAEPIAPHSRRIISRMTSR